MFFKFDLGIEIHNTQLILISKDFERTPYFVQILSSKSAVLSTL